MGKSLTIRPGTDLVQWVEEKAEQKEISVNLFLTRKLEEIKTRSEGTNK